MNQDHRVRWIVCTSEMGGMDSRLQQWSLCEWLLHGFYLSTCPFLSCGSPHLFLEIPITRSLCGGALISQTPPVRQYIHTGEAHHLFPHQWLDSTACGVVLLWALLSAERPILPSELTHANSPKSLATKSLLVKESYKEVVQVTQMLDLHRNILYIFIAHMYHYFVKTQGNGSLPCAS